MPGLIVPLPRLLRGSAAEAVVPRLLAARDARLAADAAEAEPPEEFVCAISQQLMLDPVTTAAGQTYERASIDWLQTDTKQTDTKQTDPFTGAKLPRKKLIENGVARQAIARCATSTRATPSSTASFTSLLDKIAFNKGIVNT